MVVALPNRTASSHALSRSPRWSIARCWRPCQYFGPPVHRRDRTSGEPKPVDLRDAFGCLHTRFRFALLFSRAFFVGLCIDLSRKFGQFFVSFCFFFERLLQ